jgi:hypothetical protein
MSGQPPVDPEYGIPEGLFIPELVYDGSMFVIPPDDASGGSLVDILHIQRRRLLDGWDYCLTGNYQAAWPESALPPWFQTFVPDELERQYPAPPEVPLHFLGVINGYIVGIPQPNFRTSILYGTGALRVPGGWILFGFHYQYHRPNENFLWRITLDFSGSPPGMQGTRGPLTYGTRLMSGYKLAVGAAELRTPEELGG